MYIEFIIGQVHRMEKEKNLLNCSKKTESPGSKTKDEGRSLTPYTRFNSKQIIDLGIKFHNVNIEEKHRLYLPAPYDQRCVWGLNPNDKENKKK